GRPRSPPAPLPDRGRKPPAPGPATPTLVQTPASPRSPARNGPAPRPHPPPPARSRLQGSAPPLPAASLSALRALATLRRNDRLTPAAVQLRRALPGYRPEAPSACAAFRLDLYPGDPHGRRPDIGDRMRAFGSRPHGPVSRCWRNLPRLDWNELAVLHPVFGVDELRACGAAGIAHHHAGECMDVN